MNGHIEQSTPIDLLTLFPSVSSQGSYSVSESDILPLISGVQTVIYWIIQMLLNFFLLPHKMPAYFRGR